MLNSSTKKTFSLIHSPKLSAKDNMHIDKELFERFTTFDSPIFRVYTWEESYTYGFSQKLDSIKDFDYLKNYNQNHAKRITGGGILFHGNDISYSLIIQTTLVKNLSVKQSYELLCGFLITFYESLGLNPMYAKDLEDIHLSKSKYCQEGFEPYDILIDGKKIGGNAQRRTKNTIFQHGSISVDNSTINMGNSLEDLGVKIGFEQAKDLLIKSFEDTFNVVFKLKTEDMPYAS